MRRFNFTNLYFVLLIILGAAATFSVGCRDHDVRCGNGLCLCLDGDNCDMECVSAPCEAVCADNGTTCTGECANSTCTCGAGAECVFDCVTGPCHVNCEGNDYCAGVCWNGSCNCSSGSNCEFHCAQGPCHVNCDGNNGFCDGQCANGTCNCGAGSDCRFECLDNNCKTVCSVGSACALACPNGNVGVADQCWISDCASGDIQVCADGLFTVCGMDCPTDSNLPD